MVETAATRCVSCSANHPQSLNHELTFNLHLQSALRSVTEPEPQRDAAPAPTAPAPNPMLNL
jgi:hypothetical protein